MFLLQFLEHFSESKYVLYVSLFSITCSFVYWSHESICTSTTTNICCSQQLWDDRVLSLWQPLLCIMSIKCYTIKWWWVLHNNVLLLLVMLSLTELVCVYWLLWRYIVGLSCVCNDGFKRNLTASIQCQQCGDNTVSPSTSGCATGVLSS